MLNIALWAIRLKEKGRSMILEGKERGEIDIGGILIMGIGMVFLAVGFIMYPIIITATDSLLAYTCTLNAQANTLAPGYATTNINAAYFTGFTAIAGITPLLVLIGYLSAAVFSMYLGVKIMKGAGEGGTTLDLGTILLLGISLVFIAIGLIIIPTVLDSLCSVMHADGAGISTSYTGLTAILRVTPILLLISFIASAVITGFFGIKRLTGAS